MSNEKSKNNNTVDIVERINLFEKNEISSFASIINKKISYIQKNKLKVLELRNIMIEKAEQERIKLEEIKAKQEKEAEKENKIINNIEKENNNKKNDLEEEVAEDKNSVEQIFEEKIEEKENNVDIKESLNNVVPIINEKIASQVVVRQTKTWEKKNDTTKENDIEDTEAKEFKKKTTKAKNEFEDRKKLNKKAKISKGYEKSFSSVEYDELSGEIKKIRTRKSNSTKKKQFNKPTQTVINSAIINSENVTIKQLSEKIGKPGVQIIKKLLDLGIFKNINDVIDFDTADLIASEFGVTLELQAEKSMEEKLFEFHVEDTVEDNELLFSRPPIVTIMGHVDHGKTSILDYIRKTSVATGEAGGITQHIGAYMIKVNQNLITFIDTPGHAAFTSMRARGANITDIVVIVVAADDGVMPQTIEAINHAKAANVSIIVAINKMDKPQANPDKVLQQLSEHGVLVEDWGGQIPAIKVSAKTGKGIDELLNNILTVGEIMELKANPNRSAKGTVIEARLDRGKGPVSTILVQNGTLKQKDFIVAGTAVGKIRAMFDFNGKPITEAKPSTPVSILGLQSVPNAGDQILVVNDEKLSKQVVEERKNKEKIEKLKTKKVTLEDVFNKIEEGKCQDLNLIIKADVQGSVEAIKQSLIKLSNNEVRVNIIHGAAGAINESDIMLADISNAIIIGFNIRPDTNAKSLAEKNGIDIKLYKIIYDAINDVTNAINGMLAPKYKETYLGRAEVRMIYKVSGVGTIAGCMVKDGKIERNAKLRLIRNDKEIFDSEVESLKRFKDDTKEVASGFECGICIKNYNDIKEGDIIEAYIIEEESNAKN